VPTLHAWIGLVSLLMGSGCQRDPTPATPALDDEPSAIIVVMDGTRVEESLGTVPSSATGELPSAIMPNTWAELLPRGVRATNAWNLAATITVPAHVAMVTGRRLPVANYPAAEEVGVYRPTLPTLAEALRSHDQTISRRMAVSVANTQLLQTLGHSIWPGLGYAASASYLFVHNGRNEEVPGKDDSKVIRFLKRRMERSKLRLGLINLHQVDRSGHYGEEGEYPQRVRTIDGLVPAFWLWLQQQPAYAEHSWMLLVADHGRHSAAETDPPWRHHGCSCNGCRRVPFLLVGPGVKAGQDVDDPVLLVDVGPTIGALMGVAMPWADGLVRDDLLEQPTGFPSRSGLADLAIADGHRAELRYQDDPAERTVLWLDGQRISDPAAIAVESPTLAAEGERAWCCFRELVLNPEGQDTPWRARCVSSNDGGASWQDIGFAHDEVGPYWSASAQPDGEGGLLLAYGYNPNGLAAEGLDLVSGTVAWELARWDGAAWTSVEAPGELSFPIDATIIPAEDGWFVAIGAGQAHDGQVERNTRDVWVAQVRDKAGGFAWSEPVALELRELALDDPWWRLEHPALYLEPSGRLWAAADGFVAEESMAVVAASDDGGATWPTRAVVELPQRVMPHLGPVWLDGQPVWATVDAQTQATSLCRGLPEGDIRCIDAGTERILKLRVLDDDLHALVDVGVGQWEARSWSAAAFDGGTTTRAP
jgi:hypothetical protein